MLRFTSEPEKSIGVMLARSIETILLWFDSSMLLLSESARDATVGGYPFVSGERSDHAEMVRVTHTAWWWEIATFFKIFLQSFGPRYAYGG